MTRVAIFASGNGSNFETLVKQSVNYQVVLCFCDRKDARVIKRAKLLKIPCRYLSIIKEQENFDLKILQMLDDFAVNLVALAGYLKIISPQILQKWAGKIINIHPSLLPHYPGLHAIEQAFKKGEKSIGVTVHYVDRGVDTGQIITQVAFKVDPTWTLPTLVKKISEIEHQIYSQVINQLAKEKIWKEH